VGTSLSLVSGIGGLDLGVRLAFPDIRVLAYVEREVYAASILLARMEDKTLEPAPIFCGNLEDFDARPFEGVDILTAGLPCQPYSLAGQQKGHDDERAIWPEFIRIVRECRPAVVFLENVPAFVAGGWFRQPGEKLSGLGYEIAPPLFIGARDVGAPHFRERVFILGYSSEARCKREWKKHLRTEFDEGNFELADAVRERGQQKPGGASCHETTYEGRAAQYDYQLAGDEQNMGNAEQLNGRQREIQPIAIQPPYTWPPSPSDWERWETVEETLKPAFCRMADGISDRIYEPATERLRCLGNSVVPIVAAVAFRVLTDEAGICFVTQGG